jgi:hypothetical protein
MDCRSWVACLAVGGVWAVFAVGTPARADFIPGAVYVSANPLEGCFSGIASRIYEFNPATSRWREFAVFPNDIPCGSLADLAFTPDGSRLRAATTPSAASGPPRIFEIDGDGNFSAVLDESDGIGAVFGGNGIGYDGRGYFYVHNDASVQDPLPHILRFPSGGGVASVFAERADAFWLSGGPLAFATDGAVYFGSQGSEPDLFRFSDPHQGGLFDRLPQSIRSMVGDDAGSLFLLTTAGVYKYAAGNADSRQFLAPVSVGGTATMTISPDGSTLYVARGSLVAVDAATGQTTALGSPSTQLGAGFGAAVFVPEPGSLAIFGLLTATVFLRRRER